MSRMKITLSVAIAAIVVAVGAFAIFPTTTANAKGPRLVGQMQNFQLADRLITRPEISWVDRNNRSIELADFEGKVVLFNYWASWCGPCQRELPGIDRVQAKLAGDNFEVVAMNIDREGKRVALKNARRLKLDNLKLYLDPKSVTARSLGLRAMPTTFIFDRKGNMLGRLESGAEWDTPEAHALIQYFIDNPDYADSLAGAGG